MEKQMKKMSRNEIIDLLNDRRNIDLTGADLTRVNLSGLDLRSANLTGSNLPDILEA